MSSVSSVTPSFDSSYLDALGSFVPDVVVRYSNIGSLTSLENPLAFHQPCALLFADISGFTALTEKLAAQTNFGAEHLTHILNQYFGSVVDVVTAWGGDVVKFAGDALLAVWSADEPLELRAYRAAICALELQKAVTRLAAEQSYALSMKVAVSVGDVSFAFLGGVFDRWELLPTGEPLAELGVGNGLANPGDIVVTESAFKLIGSRIQGQPLDEGALLLAGLSNSDDLPSSVATRPQVIAEAAQVVRRYIPGAIRSRLDADQTDWLGERRRVSIVFVNLPGFNSSTPIEQAHAAMRGMQIALYRFEGSINKISVDDKGASLIAVLGMPPLSHRDDPQRAVMAAQAIAQSLAKEGFACTAGVTTGHAFCGVIGNSSRREYTVMGDCVNLAARLMVAAQKNSDSGGVLCDAATWAEAKDHILFEALEPIKVKGKAQLIEIYKPCAAEGDAGVAMDSPTRQRNEARQFFVGREQELAYFDEVLERYRANKALMCRLVEGELGSGRSTLLREVGRRASERGFLTVRGGGHPIHHQVPLHGWHPVFMHLLLPSNQLTQRELRRNAVMTRLPQQMDILRYAPLLEAVIPSEWEDNEFTRGLEGEARSEKTRALLLSILQHFAEHNHFVLRLLDIQWLDSSSVKLLNAVIEKRLPLVLLLTRANDSVSGHQWLPEFLQRPCVKTYELPPLQAAPIAALAAHGLGVDQLPQQAVDVIAERSEGSPLYAEQIACALRDKGLLAIDGAHAKWVGGDLAGGTGDVLPTTIEGLITSRIDRLTPDEQLTIKVASVIGKEFATDAVSAIHPIHKHHDIVNSHCTGLDQAAFTQKIAARAESAASQASTESASAGNPNRYRFKSHLMLQVTYEMLPSSQRQLLHQGHAQKLESEGLGEQPEFSATLAYHWHRASESGANQATNALKAAMYYLRLGKLAARLGASDEAEKAFRDVLEMATRCPNDTAIDYEIDALLGLSALRMSIHGWADEQASQAFLQARQRCIDGSRNVLLFKTVRGLWQVAIGKSLYVKSLELAEEMASLANTLDDFGMQRESDRALALSRFWLGDFELSKTLFKNAIQAPPLAGSNTDASGKSSPVSLLQDTEVSARGILAWAYALTGQHTEANEEALHAVALSAHGMPPFTRAYALGSAMWTQIYIENADAAKAFATQALELSTQRGFDYLAISSRVILGAARTYHGEQDGVQEISKAIDDWRAKGQAIGVPTFLLQLAKAQLRFNMIEQAQKTLRDPLLLAALPSEPYLHVIIKQGGLEPLLAQGGATPKNETNS